MAVNEARDFRRSYCNEFIFHTWIEQLNAERAAEGRTPLMTSHARHLRRELEQHLQVQGLQAQTADFPAFSRAMAAVAGKTSVDFLQVAKDSRENYARLTGISRTPNGTRALPISPYDPRYAGNEVCLRNGGRLLYASIVDQPGEAAPVSLMDTNGDPTKLDSEEALMRVSVKVFSDRDCRREAGRLVTLEDMTGFSEISRYLKDEDRKALSSWMLAPAEAAFQEGKPLKDVVMSDRAKANTVAVLQGLQERGIGYTISPDSKPGELRAELRGTRMNVRLTDTRDHEYFVGRVYDDGVVYRYNTDVRYADGKAFRYRPYSNPSAEDTLRLVDFALGRAVPRIDAPDKVVGRTGIHNGFDTSRTGPKMKNDSCFTGGGNRTVSARFQRLSRTAGKFFVGALTDEQVREHVPEYSFGRYRPPVNVSITADFRDLRSRMTPRTAESAQAYLDEAVASAKINFAEALQVEKLIREAEQHADDLSYYPEFSGEPQIASLQRNYWDVLTGKKIDLLRPTVDEESFAEALGTDAENDELTHAIAASNGGEAASVEERAKYLYFGTREEKVRQHAAEVVEELIGESRVGDDGRSFDPVLVANFMTSQYGVFRNNDEILAATRVLNIPAESLRGDAYFSTAFRDRMVEFDENTAKPIHEADNAFLSDMGDVIQNVLSTSGVMLDKKDILIDEQGVVRWSGKQYAKEAVTNDASALQDVSGYIGQIFAPDERGLIKTSFAASDNYLFVPGYEATVLHQTPGEEKTLEERTRLTGYRQLMEQQIRYQLRRSSILGSEDVRATTSLNNEVYHKMTATRFPLDYLEKSEAEGLRPELRDQILKTAAGMVRYDTDFKEGSTVNAAYRASHTRDEYAATNDNFYDPWTLSGQRDMSQMGASGNGYFCPILTGSGKNQGITRYLASGATVASDGCIEPADSPNQWQSPICYSEEFRYGVYSPQDRQVMSLSNMMRARRVTEPTRMAHMSFGGWTMDDAFVISKSFAEKNQVLGTDGSLRPLTVGDKLCDMSGNKGVISMVVDPEETLESTERNGRSEAVAWFRENPELEVVGAPYTAPSRFNGGTVREMMEAPGDLKAPNGTIHEGCTGTARLIVTPQTVDEKLHVYDDEDLAEGKGRRASALLYNCLSSLGATEITKELYGSNSSATVNLREYLITLGLDIDETGKLREGYAPHEKEIRHVWNMPDVAYTQRADGTRAVDTRAMRKAFGSMIRHKGGFFELPFQLEFKNGAKLPTMKEDRSDIEVNYETQEWTRKAYSYMRNGKLIEIPETTAHRNPEANAKRSLAQDATYALPVMSSHLRSEQRLNDGVLQAHDYTQMYLDIFDKAVQYMDQRESLKDVERKLKSKTISSSELLELKSRQTELKAAMTVSQQSAQKTFDRLGDNVVARQFDTKHNIFRDGLLSNRIPNSATAPWTPDPRLKLNQIAISPAIAANLGVADGDKTLVWRDPTHRPEGVCYMDVHVDPKIMSCAINPVMDKRFDGDFDGDTVALISLKTAAARKEAARLFSAEATLIDKGIVDKNKQHPLLLNDGLDVQASVYDQPELAERLKDVAAKANEAEGLKSTLEARRLRLDALQGANAAMKEALDSSYGKDIISYKDMPSHIASVEHMIVNGAKGSYGKLKDYGHYLGVTWDMKDPADETKGIDLDSVVDHGMTLSTQEDAVNVEKATAIKSGTTGIAGMYVQRAIMGMRSKCPYAYSQATYLVNQVVLQSKHDWRKAVHFDELIRGPARSLWRGWQIERRMGEDGQERWETVMVDGKPVPMKTEAWVRTAMDFYSSKDGFGFSVDPELMQQIGEGMSRNGMTFDIESDFEESATLDVLAYTTKGNFDQVKKFAAEGRSVFDGPCNGSVAPRVIRENLMAAEKNEPVRKLTKTDTAEGYKPNTRVKKTGPSPAKAEKDAVSLEMAELTTQLAQRRAAEMAAQGNESPDDHGFAD